MKTPNSPSSRSKRVEKTARRGSVPCPHCSDMVQAVRLDRHIQNNHSETLPAAPQPETPAAPAHDRKKKNLFKTCPTCGKTMHRGFLAEHQKQHETAKTSSK